jgi:Squalene-hopene cyclase C-terminal domain
MKIEEIRESIYESINLFENYVNNQIVTIEVDGKTFSGFLLDLAKVRIEKRLAIGGTTFGLTLYASFPNKDELKISEIERYIIHRQQLNGSWTISSLLAYDISLIYTTSYALKSLILSNNKKNSKHIKAGLKWLFSNVNQDGGWGLCPGEKSHVHATAEVIHLLSMIDSPFNQKYFLNAKDWLLANRKEDYWVDENNSPSLFLTALVYRGLMANGNYRVTLKKAREWLLDNISDAPCREEIVYYINLGNNERHLQEPIRCFTRTLVFQALILDNYYDYEPLLEKEIYNILKKQNKLGYWNCSSNPKEIPIIMNVHILHSLLGFLDYLNYRSKISRRFQTLDMLAKTPSLQIVVLLFFLIGVFFSLFQVFNGISFLVTFLSYINKTFVQFSGFANFVTISGLSILGLIALIPIIIKFFKARR